MVMESCQLLRRDHNAIVEVLSAMDDLLEVRAAGRALPIPPVVAAIEFFGSFVERCHDAKEDQALIPLLAQKGVFDLEELQTMQLHHREARRLLQELRPWLTRRQLDLEVGDLLKSYAAAVQRHIAFQELTVFPRMEETSSADDDVRLQREFERIEADALGAGGCQVLLALAKTIGEACSSLQRDAYRTHPHLVAADVASPLTSTLEPRDNLSRAQDMMETSGRRELPVVDEGRVVGIIARCDMEPYRGHLEWTPVATAMTRDPLTVTPETSIRDVARQLLDHGFNAVPVVNGHLTGMIRRSDLLQTLAADIPR